ncbi:hypothetical protein ACKI1I_46670 [Streptomyces turgidiscabies]|uniref:hypothetical protein n=1 Tax=Streptomyces TaxID=1883 RepID=UPI000996436B|nr:MULTISPECIES: hypothetical protein [Streptomyces]MDX3500291.1 hypothetical protein [Streptomyces turgidiscabies]
MLAPEPTAHHGESPVAAKYYCADSENGDHIDDPSEDALFELISELNDKDNTFVVVQPDQDDPAWFVSVAVADEGGYEIVRRDTTRREHKVDTDTSIDRIAGDLIVWLAARNFPGRPTHQTSTF